MDTMSNWMTLDEIERYHTEGRLRALHGHRRRTAESLGRSVRWLTLKLNEWAAVDAAMAAQELVSQGQDDGEYDIVQGRFEV